jgi:hypothetical protein
MAELKRAPEPEKPAPTKPSAIDRRALLFGRRPRDEATP